MKLVADEGVDKPIVDALRIAGFNVHYILETNRGAQDNIILQIANTQQRTLITQDKDFGELVYRMKMEHFGVILIRLDGFSAQKKAEIVVNVLERYKTELEKAFTVIQPTAIRIRK